NMPMGHFYPHHGPIVTPLGPRSKEWVEAIAEDSRRGIDLFPWWQQGLGPTFYLNRALCRMWMEVRWRAPLHEYEEEEDLMTRVSDDLLRAYQGDPKLPFPWREWRQVLGYWDMLQATIPREEAEALRATIARRAQRAKGPLVGYRRDPVEVHLAGGWNI